VNPGVFRPHVQVTARALRSIGPGPRRSRPGVAFDTALVAAVVVLVALVVEEVHRKILIAVALIAAGGRVERFVHVVAAHAGLAAAFDSIQMRVVIEEHISAVAVAVDHQDCGGRGFGILRHIISERHGERCSQTIVAFHNLHPARAGSAGGHRFDPEDRVVGKAREGPGDCRHEDQRVEAGLTVAVSTEEGSLPVGKVEGTGRARPLHVLGADGRKQTQILDAEQVDQSGSGQNAGRNRPFGPRWHVGGVGETQRGQPRDVDPIEGETDAGGHSDPEYGRGRDPETFL